MKRSLSTGLVLAAIALAGVWLLIANDPARRSSGESEELEDADDQSTEAPEEDEQDAPEPDAEVSAEPVAPAAPTAEPEPEPEPEPPGEVPAGRAEAVLPKVALGPIDRLKQAYEHDPVDRDAHDLEQTIRAQFGGPHVPLEALIGVSCRKTVCRLQLHWRPEEPFSYMGIAMKLGMSVSKEIAVEPIGSTDDTKPRRYDLYLSRGGEDPAQPAAAEAPGDDPGQVPEPAP